MTLKSRPTNGYKASRKIRVRIQIYVVTLLESVIDPFDYIGGHNP